MIKIFKTIREVPKDFVGKAVVLYPANEILWFDRVDSNPEIQAGIIIVEKREIQTDLIRVEKSDGRVTND